MRLPRKTGCAMWALRADSYSGFFFKDYLFIYLFMRDREREAETQAEREAGSMQGAQRGTQSQVSRIMPWC